MFKRWNGIKYVLLVRVTGFNEVTLHTTRENAAEIRASYAVALLL
jgi:hypothetical protein